MSSANWWLIHSGLNNYLESEWLISNYFFKPLLINDPHNGFFKSSLQVLTEGNMRTNLGAHFTKDFHSQFEFDKNFMSYLLFSCPSYDNKFLQMLGQHSCHVMYKIL